MEDIFTPCYMPGKNFFGAYGTNGFPKNLKLWELGGRRGGGVYT